MSWTISTKQYIPVTIGEPFGGGFFAGYISHTANGNPTHALIVAPRATGASGTGYTLTTTHQWNTTGTSTSGTGSTFDGYANTQAMIAAGIDDHPAAKFCVDLNIGGYTDWYLPAPLELDIAYFNLKPGTENNSTTGVTNVYAVPQRNTNYTLTYPVQTPVAAFKTGSSEAFVASFHSSSRQTDGFNYETRFFNSGSVGSSPKLWGNNFSGQFRTRAFRRIPLTGYTT